MSHEETKHQRIVLKFNNAGVTAPCGLCGEPAETGVGWAPFVEGTGNPVCDGCVNERAPELYVLSQPRDEPEEFGRLLVVYAPAAWPREKRAAFRQEVSASVDRIVALFTPVPDDALPDASALCDRCHPGYICDGCAREGEQPVRGWGGLSGGRLGPDNPAPTVDEPRQLVELFPTVLTDDHEIPF